MPTDRKRHTITETVAVAAALDRLRAAHPDERVDLGALVVLGVDSKLEPEWSVRARRRGFLDAARRGEFTDPDAVRLSEQARRSWNRSVS